MNNIGESNNSTFDNIEDIPDEPEKHNPGNYTTQERKLPRFDCAKKIFQNIKYEINGGEKFLQFGDEKIVYEPNNEKQNIENLEKKIFPKQNNNEKDSKEVKDNMNKAFERLNNIKSCFESLAAKEGLNYSLKGDAIEIQDGKKTHRLDNSFFNKDGWINATKLQQFKIDIKRYENIAKDIKNNNVYINPKNVDEIKLKLFEEHKQFSDMDVKFKLAKKNNTLMKEVDIQLSYNKDQNLRTTIDMNPTEVITNKWLRSPSISEGFWKKLGNQLKTMLSEQSQKCESNPANSQDICVNYLKEVKTIYDNVQEVRKEHKKNGIGYKLQGGKWQFCYNKFKLNGKDEKPNIHELVERAKFIKEHYQKYSQLVLGANIRAINALGDDHKQFWALLSKFNPIFLLPVGMEFNSELKLQNKT